MGSEIAVREGREPRWLAASVARPCAHLKLEPLFSVESFRSGKERGRGGRARVATVAPLLHLAEWTRREPCGEHLKQLSHQLRLSRVLAVKS